jgi:hypothetical protein
MRKRQSALVRSFEISCGVVLVASCAGGDGVTWEAVQRRAPSETVSQPLTGAPTASALQAVVHIGGCTGTVIGPRHVLTARHCVRPNPDGISDLSPGVIDAVDMHAPGVASNDFSVGRRLGLWARTYAHPNLDVAIVLADRDLGVEPMHVVEVPMSSWFGRKVFAVGFGGGTPSDNSVGGSRGGWMTLDAYSSSPGFALSTEQYRYGSADPVAICGGDSGGPDLVWIAGRWQVAGVHSTGNCTPNGSNSTSVMADRFYDWVRSIVPRPGHVGHLASRCHLTKCSSPNARALSRDSVNGTRDDWVVTTSTGTQVFRYASPQGAPGPAPPQWSAIWTSPNNADWTTGNVETELADMNGDQRADLIALTHSSLKIYPSNGAGFDLNNPIATFPTFQIGVESVYVGDFNFDGWPDLLRHTWAGIEYIEHVPNSSTFRTGIGIANPAPDPGSDGWNGYGDTRTAITLGDFDGNGSTDFIVQDNFGARLWFGTVGSSNDPAGPFTTQGLMPAGFRRGEAHLVTANLVQDANSPGVDLIVSGTSGTTIWAASARNGSFETIGWSRANLVANQTAFYVGDANGDGNDDVLIVNSSGSYLYRGTGQWNNPFVENVWTRLDLPLQTTRYAFGRFDANAAEDLWITRPEASYGYLGRSDGTGFNGGAWTQDDLELMTFELRQGL